MHSTAPLSSAPLSSAPLQQDAEVALSRAVLQDGIDRTLDQLNAYFYVAYRAGFDIDGEVELCVEAERPGRTYPFLRVGLSAHVAD